ncbi:hypothetical protein NC661_08500 [Aquibacillus koreensis]|uniref:Uncharacterized protein n=1 Tax=Aquibacillus koreensis TaxID=279446 RepID=A0A9X3WN83_9BACI|nr:hypothetical protein [Aquibacillus koreensis]MCT2535948.1 hypothetical protein [Aquibacillus koreensis]MDC3420404.1 hypothetical protein [Aquibacillus koreensis]
MIMVMLLVGDVMEGEYIKYLSKEDIKKYEAFRKKLFESEDMEQMKQIIPYLALLKGKAYANYEAVNKSSDN